MIAPRRACTPSTTAPRADASRPQSARTTPCRRSCCATSFRTTRTRSTPARSRRTARVTTSAGTTRVIVPRPTPRPVRVSRNGAGALRQRRGLHGRARRRLPAQRGRLDVLLSNGALRSAGTAILLFCQPGVHQRRRMHGRTRRALLKADSLHAVPVPDLHDRCGFRGGHALPRRREQLVHSCGPPGGQRPGAGHQACCSRTVSEVRITAPPISIPATEIPTAGRGNSAGSRMPAGSASRRSAATRHDGRVDGRGGALLERAVARHGGWAAWKAFNA